MLKSLKSKILFFEIEIINKNTSSGGKAETKSYLFAYINKGIPANGFS